MNANKVEGIINAKTRGSQSCVLQHMRPGLGCQIPAWSVCIVTVSWHVPCYHVGTHGLVFFDSSIFGWATLKELSSLILHWNQAIRLAET
jgi:hypothetical protein